LGPRATTFTVMPRDAIGAAIASAFIKRI